MTAAEATAAPVPIVINGKTYRMSPLTDGATAEIALWRRKREVQIADSTMPDDVSDERWLLIHNAAVERASKISFPDPHDLQIWGTLEGLAVIYWHMLKVNHVELTLEDVATMLYDAGNLDEANSGFEILELSKKNSEAPPKKKTRSTPKRKNRRSK